MGLPGTKGENGTAGACKRVFLLLCCTVRMCAHVCASKEVFIVEYLQCTVRTYIHMCVCMYIRTYVLYVCMYVHTYICMCVHTYCTYIHVHTIVF